MWRDASVIRNVKCVCRMRLLSRLGMLRENVKIAARGVYVCNSWIWKHTILIQRIEHVEHVFISEALMHMPICSHPQEVECGNRFRPKTRKSFFLSLSPTQHSSTPTNRTGFLYNQTIRVFRSIVPIDISKDIMDWTINGSLEGIINWDSTKKTQRMGEYEGGHSHNHKHIANTRIQPRHTFYAINM